MATKLERGVALLKSLTCDHSDGDNGENHVWRECRLCLTIAEVQDHRPARMALRLVLDDYKHAKRRPRRGRTGAGAGL